MLLSPAHHQQSESAPGATVGLVGEGYSCYHRRQVEVTFCGGAADVIVPSHAHMEQNSASALIDEASSKVKDRLFRRGIKRDTPTCSTVSTECEVKT